jgi:hypothetical protein
MDKHSETEGVAYSTQRHCKNINSKCNPYLLVEPTYYVVVIFYCMMTLRLVGWEVCAWSFFICGTLWHNHIFLIAYFNMWYAFVVLQELLVMAKLGAHWCFSFCIVWYVFSRLPFGSLP